MGNKKKLYDLILSNQEMALQINIAHQELMLEFANTKKEFSAQNAAKEERLVSLISSNKFISKGLAIAHKELMVQHKEKEALAKQISQSEQQYQKMFDGMIGGFALCELIVDDQGNPKDYRFLMVNPAFEKHTNISTKSIIGKTVKEFYPDVEQSWIDTFGAVVLRNKPTQFVRYNHNTKKHYRVNAFSPMENKFVMVLEDVSKELNALEELKMSKKSYKQLFESMFDMFQVIELIYDDQGKAYDYYYLQVNPAFEKLVNKKAAELIGKRAKDIFGTIKTYEKVEKTGIPQDFQNYGAELDKHYSIHAWKVAEQKVAIIFTDITEQKNTRSSKST